MPDIYQLSPSVVNKIAAGEVIERPASVVKELLENALDAGAARIDVEVQAGGSELVRVSDDGCGIPPEQLHLAVAPHATSKIRDADDLFHVRTLGFRGEALASIAEVSRLRLTSRAAGHDAGAALEVDGGKLGDVVPCGCPPGTTIEVARLFFNTPVRRKFLRATQTEMGHVSDAVTRAALAHPEVHFTLVHQGRAVYELPGGQPWLGRIGRLFGQELAEHLIEVKSEDGDVRLWGYVAHPSHSRGNQRMQFLLINGRFVRDRSLSHALGEAYRGLLLSGRYPIAFLRLDMPPELVDVNVHPTKLEVRFQDASRLYSQLLSTLRTRFLSTDLTARLDAAGGQSDAPDEDAEARAAREELAEWAHRQVDRLQDVAVRMATQGLGGAAPFKRFPELPRHAPLVLNRVDPPRPAASTSGEPGDAGKPIGGASMDHDAADVEMPVSVRPAATPDPSPSDTHQAVRAMQIHNRYLVAESDDGVLVIDQHALHERILYEQLRAKVLSGPLETQGLLVPEPIDLSASEAAAALEHQELLAELGLRVEPFGGDTVLLSSYPAMLANLKPADVLRGLVEQLTSDGKPPDRRDLLDELLHTIACKAAIKAGDRLSDDEVRALIRQRHLVHDSHHCPHGRPTALVFTRDELDRQFMRT